MKTTNTVPTVNTVSTVKAVNPVVQARKAARVKWLNDTRSISSLVKWMETDGKIKVEAVLKEMKAKGKDLPFRKAVNKKNIIATLAILDARPECKRKYLTDKDGNEKRLFSVSTAFIAFNNMID
jgi:hypothetical protein